MLEKKASYDRIYNKIEDSIKSLEIEFGNEKLTFDEKIKTFNANNKLIEGYFSNLEQVIEEGKIMHKKIQDEINIYEDLVKKLSERKVIRDMEDEEIRENFSEIKQIEYREVNPNPTIEESDRIGFTQHEGLFTLQYQFNKQIEKINKYIEKYPKLGENKIIMDYIQLLKDKVEEFKSALKLLELSKKQSGYYEPINDLESTFNTDLNENILPMQKAVKEILLKRKEKK
jgi:hypothetical protein